MSRPVVHRYHALDALRGLAAVIVVFNHFWLFIRPEYPNLASILHWTPLHHLVDGHFAVMVFFVLSGFVLTLPFLNKPQPFRSFAIKRVCRIYIPFLAVAFLSLGLWYFFSNPSQTLAWDPWSHPIDVSVFLSNILMFGLLDTNTLNPPMWTLIIELRVALIFPLLLLFVRYMKWAAIPLATIACLLIQKYYFSCCEGESYWTAKNWEGAILLTLYYTHYFIAGIFIATYRKKLITMMSKIPLWLHLLIVLSYVFIPFGMLAKSFNTNLLLGFVFACYLIVACLYFAPIDRFLNSRPLLAIGKSSYSLYLIHSPILFVCMYQVTDIHLAILISIPLIAVSTYFTYRYIEMPSAHLGRRIAKEFSKATHNPSAISSLNPQPTKAQ